MCWKKTKVLKPASLLLVTHPLIAPKSETQIMDVKVVDAAKAESVLKTATFAGGCFWGLELAFQRAKGVVSTKAGYAQGSVKNPSYSEVCGGKTGHTEAVQVSRIEVELTATTATTM